MKYFLLVSLFALCLISHAHPRQALPREQQSRLKKRPNILFAIADDWSYGHAGAYGNRWVNTPAFDRVARAGVLFTRPTSWRSLPIRTRVRV